MPPDTPARRFAPILVETSTKSSRAPLKQDEEPPTKAAREFAVEPVETTSKSSKNGDQSIPQQAAPRRVSPEPIETSSKSSASTDQPLQNSKSRFLPQPVETSIKTNRRPQEAQTKPVSRFLPQPIETSSKSHRKPEEASTKSRSRFAPEPIETSSKSNRRSPPPAADPPSPKSTSTVKPDPPVRRKFAPVLINTSQRSRKGNNGASTYSTEHKTDVIPGVVTPRYHNSGQNIAAPELPPRPRANESERPHFLMSFERRRDRSLSSSRHRTHSFRMPDLETIESSESEPSNPPSLSSSPSVDGSPITNSDSAISELYKHATRIRESVDEGVAKYLLEIEARRAEEKMREQALAAFPNSDFHEPVEHYVDEEEESDEMEIDDRPATWEGHDEEEFGLSKTRHRDSTNVNWELKEMRNHHEQLEQERNAAKTTQRRKSTQQSPWWNPAAQDFTSEGDGRDPEMIKMRDRARPPMLGGDIRFPRSASPEPARFDVTQGSHTLRSQMCYLSEQSAANEDHEGLWGNQPHKGPSQHSNRSSNGHGLWGGDQELDDLMKESYPDSFITQVYNYLSLGYPSLARPFDEELSKISGIPLKELRHDDIIAKNMPKGYIRLGDDFEGRGDGTDQVLQPGGCKRWDALKLYIRVWAKQEKNMVRKESMAGNWGTGARRGSWAF
ncbi:hypothetical protein BDV97DRAFT_300602 [Delphinella strobiligena]|nr:hypothetical protein BDV97DRAFT_300602 [Delphinella strobiligena]